jgi:predicted CXXCH cytochrome family protein
MRKQTGFNTFFIAAMVGSAAWLACSVATAAITQQCGYCHTMHNSQNGTAFTSGLAPQDGAGSPAASTLNGSLLRWDCVGCHSGDNTSTSIDSGNGVPKVYRTAGAPNYVNGDDAAGTDNGSLAGGDFYYVTLDDTHGHNVDIVTGADTLTTPPGWDSTLGTGINGGGATWTEQVRCAGTYGCHGDHSKADAFAAISGAHHGDDGTVDGSTVGKSYRFLYGILGKEDADWEWTRQASDHNQYKGEDRPKTSAGDAVSATNTISYLCGECHGKFHNSNAGTADDGITNTDDAWMRHPTDYDMANTADTTEYAAYPGSGGAITARPYSTATPVASADVSAVLATVNLQQSSASDTAIVTCLSCHRAHGSPYADLVRWDYVTDCYAGGSSGTPANCGCFNCHTTKD